MKPTLAFISALAITLMLSLTGLAQGPTPPKKKSVSMDMNDVKAVPKTDPPKDQSKEEIKTVSPSNTNPSPLPTNDVPVDPDARLPSWAKTHKQLLTGYLESQLNGEDPAPYFYYGNSAITLTDRSTRPVSLRGSYGYKVLDFEGDSDVSLWRISIQAPTGRSSTQGIWFAVIKLAPGGDSFRIYSMSRNNPYAR